MAGTLDSSDSDFLLANRVEEFESSGVHSFKSVVRDLIFVILTFYLYESCNLGKLVLEMDLHTETGTSYLGSLGTQATKLLFSC